ncbi:GAF domain-containing protein [Bacillus sp. FSL R5-0603]|uniref:GAF domain-containing protein n=1 Tax=Bacillus sp. FSL R5-0603 TaxID=2975307 RepID=UPI0030FDE6CC
MADIISVFLDKSPPWFFIFSSIILIFILIVIAVFVSIAAKRYADNAVKENKLIKVLEERDNLKNENLHTNLVSEQLSVVITNAKSFVDMLVYIQKNPTTTEGVLNRIQKILDGLAADIKTDIGEKHRCGFWAADEESLRLICGSSGFPQEYTSSRELPINDSIAGRCFRKSQIINVADVTTDVDWSESDSSNTYKSLICIPIKDWGVVTIDAKREMNDNTLQIAQLYCSIISGFLGELYEFMQAEDSRAIFEQSLISEDEVAVNVES